MSQLAAPADLAFQTASAPGAVAQAVARLDAIAQAYAAGDTPLGELLLMQALEDDLPWDQVCTAAAEGIARRYAERDRV